MFSIVRASRAFTLPASTRVLSGTTLRAFSNSHVAREYGEGRRDYGGGGREYGGGGGGYGGGREYGGGRRDNGGGGRGGYTRYDSSARDPTRNRPPRAKQPPSTTLWIGNLPFNARPERLEELLSEFGTVVSVRLGMAPTGEPKGFAHVDFSDVASAEAVVRANAESQFFLEGRGLNMDYAGPPVTRTPFPPSNNLHISNFTGDEDTLKEALKDHADTIKNIQIMRNPQTGQSNNYGFIEFTSTEDATAVLEKFQGKEIAYGESLTLSYARGKRVPPTAPGRMAQGEGGFAYGAPGGRTGGYRDGGRPRQEYGGRGEEDSF